MSASSTTVQADEFLKILENRGEAARRFSNGPTVVVGNVIIRPDQLKLPKPENDEGFVIGFENINFLGRVLVEGMHSITLRIRETNFHQGFKIGGISARWIILRNCATPNLMFNKTSCSQLELEGIRGFEGPDSFDQDPICDWIQMRDLKVSERAYLKNVATDKLDISDGQTCFQAPSVTVDDPAFALQFHLAGIKVNISTELARKMLADPELAKVALSR